MKKVFYSLTVLAFVAIFASCTKNDDHNFDNANKSLELRAASLGFENVEDYKASVARECAAGNHENCDILNNGTHQACGYADHSGTKHDGTVHHGNDINHGHNNNSNNNSNTNTNTNSNTNSHHNNSNNNHNKGGHHN